MRRLGISIYPEKAHIGSWLKYLELAAKHGFKRVFTCLISVEGDKDKILQDFGRVTACARALGIEVIADVSPAVFRDLEISYRDLSFFQQLQISGIRLDEGFSGLEEALMTQNPFNLKIEINMSNGTKYLDNILSFKPNKENLIGCHNFYPHRYTGLSRAHFIQCSQQFKSQGIHTAAFISSKAAKLGPWQVEEGLCTLEQHRNLPLEVQAKDLFNTQLIDDVIIANAFAEETELAALGALDQNILTLNVEIVENSPDIYSKIVLEELHFNRGDISEYMIRSTQSRIKYRGSDFPIYNPKEIQRGDLLVESSLYDRYAGELQLALQPMENSGKTNVVGRIVSEEIYLLDHIQPWQRFRLKSVK